jgi:beta-ribofuranosylaminobenzene 5'-phosphate synthase
MGFIDLSGALGRQFGSIGVAINEISDHLSLRASSERCIIGPSADKAEKCLIALCRALHVSDKVEITIESAIPEHVGLGSGTQMALAIGSALNTFYGLGLTIRRLAALMDRGLRSGIGIGVFERGGLVVDGGRGSQTVTPPVIARFAMPSDWRFILIFDKRGQGLHGHMEMEAFQRLPAFSEQEAAYLCYLIMMQALPALAEHNLTAFGEVISRLQKAVGNHFAAVQGGLFTSLEVEKALGWLQSQGATALGQTSWGPTGFCLVESPKQAEILLHKAEQHFKSADQLHFIIASSRNRGGSVETAVDCMDYS